MTYQRTFTRDDGETEVEVLFTIAWGSPPSGLFGPPEDYDPGSGDEIEIDKVYTDGIVLHPGLTDAEISRFETEVVESGDYVDDGEPDYDYDYDDER